MLETRSSTLEKKVQASREKLLTTADSLAEAFVWVHFHIDQATYNTLKTKEFYQDIAQELKEKYSKEWMELLPFVGTIFYRGYNILTDKDLSLSRKSLKTFATSAAIIYYYAGIKLALWYEVFETEARAWWLAFTVWSIVHYGEKAYSVYTINKEDESNQKT